MGDTYKNIAGGHAQVTAQIGEVGGNVSFGVGIGDAADRAARDDLLGMIDDLRRELQATRRRGVIDADSADAAGTELDEAADCLSVATEESKTKFVVAMKKIKGLVEGLAGLTTKVTEAIAAAQGLQ